MLISSAKMISLIWLNFLNSSSRKLRFIYPVPLPEMTTDTFSCPQGRHPRESRPGCPELGAALGFLWMLQGRSPRTAGFTPVFEGPGTKFVIDEPDFGG